eukprot:jgi/Tetstr1/440634/TSEL_028944.t1
MSNLSTSRWRHVDSSREDSTQNSFATPYPMGGDIAMLQKELHASRWAAKIDSNNASAMAAALTKGLKGGGGGRRKDYKEDRQSRDPPKKRGRGRDDDQDVQEAKSSFRRRGNDAQDQAVRSTTTEAERLGTASPVDARKREAYPRDTVWWRAVPGPTGEESIAADIAS